MNIDRVPRSCAGASRADKHTFGALCRSNFVLQYIFFCSRIFSAELPAMASRMCHTGGGRKSLKLLIFYTREAGRTEFQLCRGVLNSWARNIKNVAPQKQNSICKTRAQDANAITLLNFNKILLTYSASQDSNLGVQFIKCWT
jgi:hypothetical protein